MDRLAAWESTWGMKFHTDKCDKIIITRKMKCHESSYTVLGHSLKKTNKAKYLGVNISSKLEWNPHIKTNVAKANKTMGFIKKKPQDHL